MSPAASEAPPALPLLPVARSGRVTRWDQRVQSQRGALTLCVTSMVCIDFHGDATSSVTMLGENL